MSVNSEIGSVRAPTLAWESKSSSLLVIILVLIIFVLVIFIIVVVIIVFTRLNGLGHKVVPIAGNSGTLGGVVQSSELRLVELAGRLEVQSGLGLVVGPLRDKGRLGVNNV